jgi:methylated-DNA-[protein]-cysteine S-methyltransferase
MLTLVENENGELTHVLFEGDPAPKDSQEVPTCAAEAGRQLNEYFKGGRKDFDLPLAPDGTEFQKSVWNALIDIPYGKTCSYGHIAAQLGKARIRFR